MTAKDARYIMTGSEVEFTFGNRTLKGIACGMPKIYGEYELSVYPGPLVSIPVMLEKEVPGLNRVIIVLNHDIKKVTETDEFFDVDNMMKIMNFATGNRQHQPA